MEDKEATKNITFTWADIEGVQYPHNNPMVVTLNINNHDMDCMLVDNRSSLDVLFYVALLKMGILPIVLEEIYGPLLDFS